MTSFDLDATRADLQRQVANRATAEVAPAVVRLADDVLDGLPAFPYAARYRNLDGVRLAHIDEGDGPPVLMLHGDPGWSFLWRDAMLPLLRAGFRCIAPDLAGFGRSDKPTDLGWYSFDRHSAHLAALVEQLDLHDATLVVHDWGGALGLRLAVDHADRFSRIVITDTDLHTGEVPKSGAWHAFRQFVEENEDLPVGGLIAAGCHGDLDPDVIAAYEAPYPTPASKAGARAFPLLHPLSPTARDARTMQRVRDKLRADSRPILLLWADSDPVLPLSSGEELAADIGRPPPRIIEAAGHFWQEDRGHDVGELIADWLDAGSPTSASSGLPLR